MALLVTGGVYIDDSAARAPPAVAVAETALPLVVVVGLAFMGIKEWAEVAVID